MTAKSAVRRVACIQCGEDLLTYATNFCTVCAHNGLDNTLTDTVGFLQRSDPFPEPMQMAAGSSDGQLALGDFR